MGPAPPVLPAWSGRIGVVVARFHGDVTSALLQGALDALHAANLRDEDIEIVHVPGAFEIPVAARALVERRLVRAVVCLGCVIRGQTPHFDYISSACALGVMNVATDTGVPMAFGVLTTNTIEEAEARSEAGDGNKGREAAQAALEMAGTLGGLKRGRPHPGPRGRRRP
jgi:6,7-dimethyl-8-ribityllumazine synthase